jgi:hypothetical protein
MINDSLKFFISIRKSGCYTEAPLVLPWRVAVLPPSLFRLHVLVRDSLNHGNRFVSQRLGINLVLVHYAPTRGLGSRPHGPGSPPFLFRK